MSDVRDVRVLVSGGTSGLGYAMSAALVTGGAQVVLTGRDAERTTAAAAQLAGSGPGRALGIVLDVRDERSVSAGVIAVREALGGVDVLVNNAGIGMRTVNRRFMTDPQPFWDVAPDGFRDLFATNVTGYFLLARAVAPLMIKAGHGKIINVSSISATVISTNRGDYCISKAGIAMATQLWAARLTEFGIDVFEVRPGIIATDMTSGVKEKYDKLIETGLLLDKRWGTPQDVGKAVTALAKGEIPYAPGQVLVLDGGLTLQRL